MRASGRESMRASGRRGVGASGREGHRAGTRRTAAGKTLQMLINNTDSDLTDAAIMSLPSAIRRCLRRCQLPPRPPPHRRQRGVGRRHRSTGRRRRPLRRPRHRDQGTQHPGRRHADTDPRRRNRRARGRVPRRSQLPQAGLARRRHRRTDPRKGRRQLRDRLHRRARHRGAPSRGDLPTSRLR